MQKQVPEDGQATPSYPISSVNNALRLLLLFREQQSVRLTEACQYLGVAHSTAHRLLAMLAFHGFVRQDPGSRAYVAGPALVDVGLAVVQALDVRGQARPALEELAARFEETAHLAVLEGNQIRYLDAVESNRTLRVTARTGALTPAHCTSVGKALLAELSAEDLRALYPQPNRLETRTSRSITTLKQLQKELEAVRKQGYALNHEESEDGVGSVAIAYRGLGQQSASIAVAAPTSRLDDERIAAMAQALAGVVEKSRYIQTTTSSS
jgi:IclR family acetate operon transcriptional repressor